MILEKQISIKLKPEQRKRKFSTNFLDFFFFQNHPLRNYVILCVGLPHEIPGKYQSLGMQQN